MKRLMVIVGMMAGLLSLPAIAEAETPKFQVRCASSHIATEDPIVAPGTASGHEHEFFGNTSTNKDSTYASMTGQPTTCSAAADTAGYWTPTVLRADGSRVRVQSILVYYRGNNSGHHVRAFPPDLRVVSDAFKVGNMNSKLMVSFPPCWDGQNTDSPNHRSHMSFRRGSGCPSSHPVHVPKVTVIFRYPEQVTDKMLSSGALSTGHADFWNTWQQQRLENLVDSCLNAGRDCGRIDGA